MSAYIVNDKVVQIIAEGFLKTGTEYKNDDYKPEIQIIINHKKAIEEIAQSLINYNYKSVNYRYNETTAPHKFQYTDGLQFDYELLYNAVGEYDYQACEPEDYYTSPIHFSLERLKDGMITHFLRLNNPEYEYHYNRYYEVTKPEPIEPEETQEEPETKPEPATPTQEEYFNNLMELLS